MTKYKSYKGTIIDAEYETDIDGDMLQTVTIRTEDGEEVSTANYITSGSQLFVVGDVVDFLRYDNKIRFIRKHK